MQFSCVEVRYKVINNMKNKALVISIIAVVAVVGIMLVVTNRTPHRVIQSHRTYHLQSDSNGKTYAVNTPSEYSFTIVDEQGNTLKDFTITHTKILHLIVVRKDLAYFQHIHPDFNPTTGIFTLKGLTFPVDGTYRIFADFAPGNAQMDAMGMPLTATVLEDVSVGNSAKYTPQPIGTEETTKTFRGLTVKLAMHGTPISDTQNMLMFNLSQNGKPVTDLQPYLGALGHAVILRESTLDFIHAHPIEDVSATQNGLVDFMVSFPEAGKYKVFTQFQQNGKVITTDFVVTVAQGADNSADSMPGMDMSNPNSNMSGMHQ